MVETEKCKPFPRAVMLGNPQRFDRSTPYDRLTAEAGAVRHHKDLHAAAEEFDFSEQQMGTIFDIEAILNIFKP